MEFALAAPRQLDNSDRHRLTFTSGSGGYPEHAAHLFECPRHDLDVLRLERAAFQIWPDRHCAPRRSILAQTSGVTSPKNVPLSPAPGSRGTAADAAVGEPPTS